MWTWAWLGGVACLLVLCAGQQGGLTDLVASADLSLLRELRPDPQQQTYAPNMSPREVTGGHFVLVRPTPLPDPVLVTFSESMAGELNLSAEACRSEPFLRAFSGGDVEGFRQSWATPYSISIYGHETVPDRSGPKGDGYGDGRAISILEVLVKEQRWELQLKGSGKTPFSRSGDGRAVLRSSVREFLASECMWALGVPTTRALSLVVSRRERVV